ncbi:LIC_10461 domain-containing protein [Leptospira limi]|uniref:Lipoprotein n=1 Tax=Leptospira limi TaxID=2950023 RepID=A0ABT3LWQ4_9LEPT|nr:hypothetical protein [Leptospira limi]MCW7462161.1 hypothetical protein [Leptospira limi]
MKWITIFSILFFFGRCHTTVIKIQKSELDINKMELKQNQTHQASLVFGYTEVSDPSKSNCRNEKTKAIVLHRDWKDKLIHVLIGGIYSSKSISIYCDE